MLIRAVSVAVALTACSHSPTPAPAPTPVALSGVSLFCAAGTIGLRPEPLPKDYDAEYVVAVVDIDNPGAPLTGVSVTMLELADQHHVVAHMRRVQEASVFAPTAKLPALESSGSWAIYADSPLTPFSGALVHGHTRLRIRAWLDVGALGAAHAHIVIGNADHQVVIDGAITGSFPS